MDADTDFNTVVAQAGKCSWKDYSRIKTDLQFGGYGDTNPVVLQLRRDKLRFQDTPIHTSLLTPGSKESASAYEKRATELHKLILILCGEKGAGTPGLISRFASLYEIVRSGDGAADPEHNIAEEFFFLLMKQICENPRFESECLAWKLLCFGCCCVKLHSFDALCHVVSFLLHHSGRATTITSEHIAIPHSIVRGYAEFCLRAIDDLQRGECPTRPCSPARLGSFLVFEPLFCNVVLADDSIVVRSFPIRHCDSGEELCAQVLRKLNVHTGKVLGEDIRWQLAQRFDASAEIGSSDGTMHPVCVEADSVSTPLEVPIHPHSMLLNQVRATMEATEASQLFRTSEDKYELAPFNILHLQNAVKRLRLHGSSSSTMRHCTLVLRASWSVSSDCKAPTCPELALPYLCNSSIDQTGHFTQIGKSVELHFSFDGLHLEKPVRHLRVAAEEQLPDARLHSLRLLFLQAMADSVNGTLQFVDDDAPLPEPLQEWLSSKFPILPLTNDLIIVLVTVGLVSQGQEDIYESLTSGANTLLGRLFDHTPRYPSECDPSTILRDSRTREALLRSGNDGRDLLTMYHMFFHLLSKNAALFAPMALVRCCEIVTWTGDKDADALIAKSFEDHVRVAQHRFLEGGCLTTQAVIERDGSTVRVGGIPYKVAPPATAFLAGMSTSRAAAMSVDHLLIAATRMGVCMRDPRTQVVTMLAYERCRWRAIGAEVLLLDVCTAAAPDATLVLQRTYIFTPVRAAQSNDSLSAADISYLLDRGQREWMACSGKLLHAVDAGGRLVPMQSSQAAAAPRIMFADFSRADTTQMSVATALQSPLSEKAMSSKRSFFAFMSPKKAGRH